MELKFNSPSTGYLNSIRNFLMISSLPVAISGGILQFAGYLLAGLEPDRVVCCMVFLVTFSIYTLNKLSDIKEDAINTPERLILSEHKEMVLILAGTAYVLCLYLGWKNLGSWGCIYLAPILANLAYSYKLPGLPRLKEIPGVKGLVVAATWAVIVGGPLEMIRPGAGLIVGAWVLIQIFIDVVVYDVRDIQGDRVSGVRTLPVVLGSRKTAALLLCVNALLLILLPFVEAPGLALAMVFYGFGYILYFSERRDPMIMDLFVENNWLVVLGVFYLLGSLV